MTKTEKLVAKFTELFKKGLIDKAELKQHLADLDIDINNSNIGILGNNAHADKIHQGDEINIQSGKDAIFAKDHAIAVIIKHLDLSVQEIAVIEKTVSRYLNKLAAETNRLPWGRLTPEQAGPENRALRLSDVYTALDTTEPEHMDCEDDVRKCLVRQEKEKDNRISAQQMIHNHDRVVLLGDPGSGKTTLVNFLTHVMACAGFEKDADACMELLRKNGNWGHKPMFPLRILLRDFAAWKQGRENDRHADMDAFIRYTLDEEGYNQLWDFIQEGLQNREIPFLVLFDGLDEAGADIRKQVVDTINKFKDTYPHNRYIVTCRIYAYLDPAFRVQGFKQTVLAPFSKKQIYHFIDAWYSELLNQNHINSSKSKKLAQRLKTAVNRPDLLDLAQLPLIMTVMALLHTSYGQLPEDRVELYRWAVELLFRRWKGQGKQGKTLIETLEMPHLRINDLEAGLYHAAFHAHSGHAHTQGTADIPEEKLLKYLKPYIGSWDNAEKFVNYIRERAGLLIRHKNQAYTFPHRTFQEFMAACHITGQKDYPSEASKLIYQDPDRWRIVFVLAAGHAARTHQLGNAVASINKLCPAGVMEIEKPGKKAFIRAVISGQALLEIGLMGVNREQDGETILNRVKAWLLAGMKADDVLQPKERVEAGNILSQLGDPRFDPENYYLPFGEDMGFVTVPEGEFLMGSDKKKDSEADDDELPQHTVYLSEYKIARYPVTVAQYIEFAKDTGVQLDGEWKEYNIIDNHPVVIVDWNNAAAYCEWLTNKLREKGMNCRISLPTEAQWEKAARGTDGRIYPCGNKLTYNKANYNFNFGSTSPVGNFVKDISYYNCMDMTGNVWERCHDWYDEYSSGSVTDPVGPETGWSRVVRGGSWNYSARACRSASRGGNGPDGRDFNLGFRLVFLPG